MDRRKFLQSTATLGLRARRPAACRARRQARAAGGRAGALDRLPADVHRHGQELLRRVRHRGEDRHHRDRRRPHQRGAVGPGLRLHRRPRAQRLRQGQGRRAARRRALRRPRQRLFLRGQGPRPQGHQLAGLLQGQDDRGRPLWRHAQLDHALPADEVESRRQARRDALRDAELRRAGRRPGRTSRDRRHHRADDHAGHQAGLLERAVLQRAEGARSLRLFHHQRPPGIRSRSSPRWCAASSAA